MKFVENIEIIHTAKWRILEIKNIYFLP
jgi:hypothetical protein